jgi:hypothetical protein
MPRPSRRPSKKLAARSRSSDPRAFCPDAIKPVPRTGFFVSVPGSTHRPGRQRLLPAAGSPSEHEKAPLIAGLEGWNVPGESVLVSTLGFVPHSSHNQNLNRSFPKAGGGRSDYQVASPWAAHSRKGITCKAIARPSPPVAIAGWGARLPRSAEGASRPLAGGGGGGSRIGLQARRAPRGPVGAG